MLKVKNLCKNYGPLEAVNNLNFQVQKGEIFGLIGPNGSGKTTSIECILDIKTKDQGSVSINNQPVSQVLSKIGVQFQSSFFPEKIKVFEICKMMSVLYGDTFDYRVLLEEFGLADKKDKYVSMLSGGQKQKLSVLLALINKPKIVFLDELTTGLDPEARRDVWNILKALQKKGLTIFLTSHYMEEVFFLCDRLMIIKKGKYVVSGTPKEVIKSAGASTLEEAYLFYMEDIS